jgi:signal transduction histidine kinase
MLMFTLIIQLSSPVQCIGQVILPADTARLSALLKQVSKARDTSVQEAMKLLPSLKALALKIHVDSLTAKVFIEEGYCHYYAGDYKKAVLTFDSASALWRNSNAPNYAMALNRKGTAQMYNSEYYNALVTYFESLPIFEKLADRNNSARVLNNIGLVYESIGDWTNAMQYGRKSLLIKLQMKDSLGIANSYGNIGNVLFSLGKIDSCIYYQQVSLAINTALDNKAGISNALGAIGNCYREKKMPDSSIAYLNRAFELSNQLGNVENNAAVVNNLAVSYLQKNDLVKCLHYAQMVAGFVPQITDKEFLHEYYNLMYRYYEKKGDISNAYKYLKILSTVDDSLYVERTNIQSEKLSVSYEYKQKNLEDKITFEQQLNTSEKRTTAQKNRFIIAALLLLLTGSLAAIWYNRVKLLEKKNQVAEQNTLLKEQQIRELENEKQLLVSHSIMQGQEDERSRLAKDLHDGLGGLLTGVKHSIVNMKERFILTKDHVAGFEKSLAMIDLSMQELRRIAQNMMPEALAKFGLEEAIKDYCAGVSNGPTSVHFESFGESSELDSTAEIMIYRIIQELVNNACKHAAATEVVVQLIKGPDWVRINVEDDGKGFDTAMLKASKGVGWGSIQNRVDYLQGNIDIKSEAGSGTSVSIELKINKS